MRVGIISDTHDNIWNIDRVFEKLKAAKVEALIHCGDFCAPFSAARLDNLGVPVHCVFGNTDDRLTTPKKVSKCKRVTLYGDTAEFELDSRKIAVNHFPKIAKALASTGDYDAVFFGHNHTKSKEVVGKTLLANPGELSGVANPPSYGIYNTEKNDIELFDL